MSYNSNGVLPMVIVTRAGPVAYESGRKWRASIVANSIKNSWVNKNSLNGNISTEKWNSNICFSFWGKPTCLFSNFRTVENLTRKSVHQIHSRLADLQAFSKELSQFFLLLLLFFFESSFIVNIGGRKTRPDCWLKNVRQVSVDYFECLAKVFFFVFNY